MKNWFAAVLFALCGPVLAANEAPLYWTYQYVITTSDDELSVAQLVFDLPKKHPDMCDQPMLDLLAEFLANANVNDPSYEKGIKEVFDILEKGEPARYRTVVGAVGRRAKNSSIHNIAVSYVKEHKEKVPQYVAGTIDRQALRRQYARDALAMHHSDGIAARLAALPLDGSVNALFNAVGRPDAVSGYQRRMTDGMLIHIRTPYLYYFYRGIGRVIFEYDDHRGWIMRKVTINPLAFEPQMPYRDFAAELKLQDDESLELTMLLSGDGPSTQIAVQTNHDRPKPAPTSFMDTAAELLLSKYGAPIPDDQRDAYGWICRLLTHKGGPRYANVLKTVAGGAADKKLRRYAELKIESAPGANPVPYVPGSVKLGELRGAYPVPYPPLAASMAGHR
jgi:hypothetical protein